jgi:co-chaperonin GroES (HSP10)
MKILGDYILVKPVSQTFDTSLYVPDKRLENKGEVLAVGNKVGDFKVGDTVFFNKFAAHEVEGNFMLHHAAVTLGFKKEDF